MLTPASVSLTMTLARGGGNWDICATLAAYPSQSEAEMWFGWLFTCINLITLDAYHKVGILKWQRFDSFFHRSGAKVRGHHFTLTHGIHADTLETK